MRPVRPVSPAFVSNGRGNGVQGRAKEEEEEEEEGRRGGPRRMRAKRLARPA